MEAFSNVPWECDFRTHPAKSPLVGLFIESRDHILIDYALRNFSCMLPFASLYVMHSKENEATIKRVIGQGTHVTLELLPEGFGELDCNLLKLSPDLWSRFMKNYEKVLIFNVDTGIKHNSILRFMHYDYIGAPWNHFPTGDPRVFQGNGGFSLRSSWHTFRLAVENPCPVDNTKAVVMPEDVWYASGFYTGPLADRYKLPTRADCNLFATEGNDTPGTLGFHDTEKYNKNSKNVYVVMDGPTRKLVNVISAVIDDRHDVLKLVRLGVGPKGLRIFRQTDFGVGTDSVLEIVTKKEDREPRVFKLELIKGKLKEDVLIVE